MNLNVRRSANIYTLSIRRLAKEILLEVKLHYVLNNFQNNSPYQVYVYI